MEEVLFEIVKDEIIHFVHKIPHRVRRYINDQIGVEKLNLTNNKWYVCGGEERDLILFLKEDN